MKFACVLLIGTIGVACGIGASSVSAQVISITQAKAVAGNITAGDAPGFPVQITVSGSYRLDTNLTPGPRLGGSWSPAQM